MTDSHPTFAATHGNWEDLRSQWEQYFSNLYNHQSYVINSNNPPNDDSGCVNEQSSNRFRVGPSSRASSPFILPPPTSLPAAAPVPHLKPCIPSTLPNTTPYFPPLPTIQPEDCANSGNSQMYIAVNPFNHSGMTRLSQDNLPVAQINGQDQIPIPLHDFVYPSLNRRTLLFHFFTLTFNFLLNKFPRECYQHILLRMPTYYFSRVARIFEETKMTMAEIEGMALQGMDSFSWQPQVYAQTPTGANLKSTWEAFIESLLEEWKTLNIVSVLLLSTILTMLEIESASADPITRNCALFSLICALMSLLYGCIYIIRFSSMRKTYKALEWAQEAQKTETVIWWNTWVLLAMPATWLAWSLILFVACIMAFVWRTGTNGIEAVIKLSPRAELGLRVGISSVLALGIIYLALIVSTLRLYGNSMDKKFETELELRVKQKKELLQWYGYIGYPRSTNQAIPVYPGNHWNPGGGAIYSRSANHGPRPPPGQPFCGATKVKVMNMRFLRPPVTRPLPKFLADRSFKKEDWVKFVAEVTLAWNGDLPLSKNGLGKSSRPRRPQDNAALVLELWNREYFRFHGTLGILCREYLNLFPDSPLYTIYLVDMSTGGLQPNAIADHFGPVPDGLTRIDIFHQAEDDGPRKRMGKTSIFASSSTADNDRRKCLLGQGQSSRAPNLYAIYEHSLLPPEGTGIPLSSYGDPIDPRMLQQPHQSQQLYQPQYPPTLYHPVDIAPELVSQHYSQRNVTAGEPIYLQHPSRHCYPVDTTPELVNHDHSQRTATLSPGRVGHHLPHHPHIVGESRSCLQYSPTDSSPLGTAPVPVIPPDIPSDSHKFLDMVSSSPSHVDPRLVHRPLTVIEPSYMQYPPIGNSPMDITPVPVIISYSQYNASSPSKCICPRMDHHSVGEPNYQYPPINYDPVEITPEPVNHRDHCSQPINSHASWPLGPPPVVLHGASEQHHSADPSHCSSSPPPRRRTRRTSHRSSSHSLNPILGHDLPTGCLPSVLHKDVQPLPL